MADDREAELKFTLRREDLAVLAGSAAVRALAAGGGSRETLVTTYHDTADQRLRKAGASLRIRRKADAFEETVKIGGDLASGFARRTEINAPVTGETVDLDALPDAEVRDFVRATIGEAPLVPLFTMTVERTAWILAGRTGEVEFVLDDGRVTAVRSPADVLEAEFELKAGDVRSLFETARAVMTAVPVRIAGRAKAEIGFDLVDGVAAASPEPVRAAEADLDAAESVESALQKILRSCVAQIIGNVAVIGASDDPEGPHQLRVGLRRLRSALTLFKPVIAPVTVVRLGEEMKWLGEEVGRLRDLDVLIEEVVGPCAGAVDVSALTAVLAERREAAKEKLLADVSGPRVGGLVLDLIAFTEGRGWLSLTDLDQSAALTEPVGDFAVRAVHERWRKVARKGRDVDRLDEEERHELRKAFKKLRYTLDFLAPQLGRRDGRKLFKDVKAAQEVLGYLNDVHTARAMAASLWADPAVAARADYPRIERALGYCLGWHDARAARVWEEAKDLVSLDPDEA